MNPLDDITGLDATRWKRARKQAQQTVISTVQKPDKRLFTGRAFGRFPAWVTAIMLIVLGVIAIAAFWISAGKQIAATDLVLMPVVHDYQRLSAGWADVSILLNLLLGELGTILFSLAAGIFQGDPIRLGRLRFRPLALAFRLAAVVCACFAILANVTITALHAGAYANVAVFGWFMTFAPPVVVLWVGLFFERLLLATLEARTAARDAFNRDYDQYETVQRNPEAPPDFRRTWHLQIYDQLLRISPANRRKIEALVAENPVIRVELIKREFTRHEWADFTIETPPSRPTIPPPTGGPYLSPNGTWNVSSNGSEQPSATQ